MFSQSASEHSARRHLDAQPLVERAGSQEDQTQGLLVKEDVDVASRSSAKLLITASTPQAVETLARRIHESGARARFPFVMTGAGELPAGAQALRDGCVRFLDAAAGGSVLVSAVEEMPATVQETLIDLLAELEVARGPSAAVRLISGTTVSLFDRVAAGTFSERLFYRLNTIQIVANAGPLEATLT